jgi:hypothetical protein
VTTRVEGRGSRVPVWEAIAGNNVEVNVTNTSEDFVVSPFVSCGRRRDPSL